MLPSLIGTDTKVTFCNVVVPMKMVIGICLGIGFRMGKDMMTNEHEKR